MPENVRRVVLDALVRIDSGGEYSTHLIDQLRADKTLPHSQKFIEALIKGVLEKRAQLDAVPAKRMRSKLNRLSAPMRNLLRLGCYEILFGQKVPFQAAVNEAVALAKIHGHGQSGAFANALLRRIAREKDEILSSQAAPSQEPNALASSLNHPAWLIERWIGRFGLEETRLICQANNQQAQMCLRTNPLKGLAPEIQRSLREDGFEVEPSKYLPFCFLVRKMPPGARLGDLASFKAGLFWIQDESSAAVPLLLDAKPGELVIDLCAAPGCKTLGLGASMQNQGEILALDLHAKRLSMVRDNCQRAGLSIVKTITGDAADFKFLTPADRVLIDAPCSGFGALSRRADARWNKKEEDLSGLVDLQRTILSNGAKLTRPGGRLVYSTCTIEPDENENQIEWFLKRHPEFKLLSAAPYLPAALVDKNGFFCSLPHRHGIGGAFGAILSKV